MRRTACGIVMALAVACAAPQAEERAAPDIELIEGKTYTTDEVWPVAAAGDLRFDAMATVDPGDSALIHVLSRAADEGPPAALGHLTVEADSGPDLLGSLRDERLARVHVNGADDPGLCPASHEELQGDLRVVSRQRDQVLRQWIGERQERGLSVGFVSLGAGFEEGRGRGGEEVASRAVAARIRGGATVVGTRSRSIPRLDASGTAHTRWFTEPAAPTRNIKGLAVLPAPFFLPGIGWWQARRAATLALSVRGR